MVCIDINVRDELEEHSLAGLDASVCDSWGHSGCPSNATNALDLALVE